MKVLIYPFINFFECTPSCECPALSLFHSPNELDAFLMMLLAPAAILVAAILRCLSH